MSSTRGDGVAVEKRVQQKKIAALAMPGRRGARPSEHGSRASIFTLPSRIDLQGMLPFCCDCYLEGMPLEAYKNTSARSRGCSWRSRPTSTGYLT